MRAVVLARVSRGDRSQKTDAQVSALKAQAARKGWEVVEVVEQVKSAWNAKAAAEVHDAALRPILEGRADVLMVWSLDRAVRGGVEAALSFVNRLENHHGAALYSLQEPFLSTATFDPATRELMLPILAWVAKWESQRKSERLTAKAAAKRAQAEKLGQRASWGRGKMASEADRLVVAEMLRQVPPCSQRSMAAATGLSLGAVNKICQELKQ